MGLKNITSFSKNVCPFDRWVQSETFLGFETDWLNIIWGRGLIAITSW